jgi:hypothetical protein
LQHEQTLESVRLIWSKAPDFRIECRAKTNCPLHITLTGNQLGRLSNAGTLEINPESLAV